jgi:branched-chain amino acid transport system substrate-binding protein
MSTREASVKQATKLPSVLCAVTAMALLASACQVAPGMGGGAQKPSELKVAMVDFQSGPAAKFGTAALNAGKMVFDQINEQGGIGGVKVNYQTVDEAGAVDQVVSNYRRVVLDEKADAVIGYTSSANCLAVAPVAEELKKLTIIHICGTPRLFEENQLKYVVRAAAHGVTDSVGAALYATAAKPDLKTVSAINDDYAWGRDSWELFSHALMKIKPDVQVREVLWPKLQQGEYSAEISKLQAARSDIIHTSLWGGHMDSFIKQAQARGLFNESLVVFTTGETGLLTLSKDMPPGIAVSGRGQYLYIPEPEKHEMNRKFIDDYTARYGEIPVYPAYRMAQAALGMKEAYDKAIKAKNGAWPTTDEVLTAWQDLTYETPTGTISTKSHHDTIQPAVYGITGTRPDPKFGFPLLDRIQTFPAEQVNPPVGQKTLEWIQTSFGRR